MEITYSITDQVDDQGRALSSCSRCGKLLRKTQFGPHKSGHVRQDNQKYVYLNGDNKHPYEEKSCKNCGETSLIQVRRDFCSRACSKQGEFNPHWNPDSDYKKYTRSQMTAFHQAVEKSRGSAKEHGCEHCGTQEIRMYHWANISGNYTDVYDYISLCVPCHYKYDAPKRAAARAADESQD